MAQEQVYKKTHRIHGSLYAIDILDEKGNLRCTAYGATPIQASNLALALETVMGYR